MISWSADPFPRSLSEIDARAWRSVVSRPDFAQKRRRSSATSSISGEIRTEKTKSGNVSGYLRQAPRSRALIFHSRDCIFWHRQRCDADGGWRTPSVLLLCRQRRGDADCRSEDKQEHDLRVYEMQSPWHEAR